VPEPMYSLLRCELVGEEPRALWDRPAGGKLWEVIGAGELSLART
jgi:hypothetical protein